MFAEYTYEAARAFMAKARDKSNGRPLQNNTRMYERQIGDGGTYYAVRLHTTDVVEIHPRGKYVIYHGGWTTPTTSDRIRTYAPVDWRRLTSKGDGFGGSDWFLRCRPKKSDPEPPNPRYEIPVAYSFADPGPEPVKDPRGCKVGERHTKTEMKTVYVKPDDVREREIPELPSYYQHKVGTAPTRARDVLAHIASAENRLNGPLSDVCVTRPVTDVWDIVETINETYRGNRTTPGIGQTYVPAVQCEHCKAFDQLHARWHRLMHGGYGTRNRSYSQHVTMLERYGSLEAWAFARRQHVREVRAARKLYKEWLERNTIPFTSRIAIDSDGYPLRWESERILKAQRAEERRQRAAKRANEARERKQRQLERFKARIHKKRGTTFEGVARRTAEELQTINLELQSANSREVKP